MACQAEAWRRLDEHQGSAPCIPVWKTGVYLSTLMLEKWNPVLESHQPLQFCKLPPELLGQRDTWIKKYDYSDLPHLRKETTSLSKASFGEMMNRSVRE